MTFNLTRSLHTHNAARGVWAVRKSAQIIAQHPDKYERLMPLHRTLAGRTLASFKASKETANG